MGALDGVGIKVAGEVFAVEGGTVARTVLPTVKKAAQWVLGADQTMISGATQVGRSTVVNLVEGMVGNTRHEVSVLDKLLQNPALCVVQEFRLHVVGGKVVPGKALLSFPKVVAGSKEIAAATNFVEGTLARLPATLRGQGAMTMDVAKISDGSFKFIEMNRWP